MQGKEPLEKKGVAGVAALAAKTFLRVGQITGTNLSSRNF
jgi:hypothetical protein